MMATSKGDTVSQFLDLLERKRFGRVAKELEALVGQICSNDSPLLAEKEQKLRLQPTKAFKKVTKLWENHDVGHGILSIIEQDSPSALPILLAVERLCNAPQMAAQVASCGAAVALSQCADWVLKPLLCRTDKHGDSLIGACCYMALVYDLMESVPQFVKEAYENKLPSKILLSLPWSSESEAMLQPSQDPRLRESALVRVSDIFNSFLQARNERLHPLLLEEVTAEQLALCLVNFFSDISRALIQWASIDGLEKDIQQVAGRLCGHLAQQPQFVGAILQTSKAPQLKRALEILSPMLTDTETQTHFVHLRGRIKSYTGEDLKETAREDLTQAELDALRARFQEIDSCPLAELWKQLVACMDLERDPTTVSDFEAFIRSCNALPVLLRAFKRALKVSGGRRQALGSRGPLWCALRLLTLYLGMADLTSCVPASEFDAIGACMLESVGPVLRVLGQDIKDYLEVLVFCFNSGHRMRLQTKALAIAAVRCLDTETPNGLAAVTGWQLLAVLLGARACFEDSGFGVIPKQACTYTPIYWARHFTSFVAKHGKIDPAVLDAQEAGRVARLAVAALVRKDINALFTWPSDAASILCALCERYPVILRDHVAPSGAALVSLCELAYVALCKVAYLAQSQPSKELPFGAPALQRVECDQQTLTCRAVCRVMSMCLDCPKVDQGPLIESIVQGGGVELCRIVMRTDNCDAPPVSLELDAGQVLKPDQYWAAAAQHVLDNGLHLLADALWERIEQRFDLKECSAPGCTEEVIEPKPGAFRMCSTCKSVQYCSRDCQVRHWKLEHKVQCKERAKLSSSAVGP